MAGDASAAMKPVTFFEKIVLQKCSTKECYRCMS